MKTFPQKAIVLAAGFGTRLLPLTKKVPKPVLPVGGVPILLFNLYLLHQAGISEITINLHHRPEKIRSLLRNHRKLGLQLNYSVEPKILGTAGGIAKALRGLGSSPLFVFNGDILCDLDLRRMWNEHLRARARATLAVVSPSLAKVTSFVEYDRIGNILRIAGAPAANSPAKLHKGIFTGIHILDPKLFAEFPAHAFGCVIRSIYQPALARKDRLQAYLHQGNWWDLGSLSEMKKVDEMLWKEEAPRRIQELWRKVKEWSQPLWKS